MATAKKVTTTTKKRTAAASTARKSTAKKAPTRAAAPKRAPAKTAKTRVTRVARPKRVEMQSFKRAPQEHPFMTFKITQQTIYWLVLCLVVLLLGVWVTVINVRVQKIYDDIDSLMVQDQGMPVKKLRR